MPLHRRKLLRDAGLTGAGLCFSRSLESDGRSAGTSDETVTCLILDKATGKPVPARVRLINGRGEELVPIGHTQALSPDAHEGDVRFQSRRFAYVNGRFDLPLSALPVRYQILKGYEYGILEDAITQNSITDGRVEIPLERLSLLGQSGWYSGDIHIHHIDPKTCGLEMEAEDLNVANILTSDFTSDQDRFEGKLNAESKDGRLIYVNQEFRNNELGHLCLLNLKQLIEPVKEIHPYHHPLHLALYDQVHRQGGYASWAHFPSWPGVECPLDVAMEKLDGLEILSVLEPRDFPVFMKQVVPEQESNDGLRLWYRFLNCGFRLTATAGTDKMTTFVTVGANRVYAQVDGHLTYQGWIDALKAGRTFITNSPILSCQVNGKAPGATLNLDSKGKKPIVEIEAAAESQLPYHHLEVVCNGQVIAEATPSGPRHHSEIRMEYPVHQSCWIASRAFEDIKTYRTAGLKFSTVHIEAGTLHGNYFGTRRPETVFAHSSPHYVTLDGRPIRSWDDARYYVRYLDLAIQWLKTEAKFASESDKRSSIEAFRRGQAIYEERAKEAHRSQTGGA
jgi:hypothetical protein